MAPLIWSAVGLVIKMQLSGLKVCRGKMRKRKWYSMLRLERVLVCACWCVSVS